MRLKRKESDLKQIIAQAQGAKTRLKYSKAELENLQKKNIKCQAVGPQNYFRWNIVIETVFFESQRILDIKKYIVLNSSEFYSTKSVLSHVVDCFQEISRMDSELANLDSQVQMQQESVEAKDAEMRRIRDQIDQVVLFQCAGFDCCFDPHAEVTSETITISVN